MLIAMVIFIIGILGAMLIAVGAWLIYPPAGLVVGGVLLLIMSWMSARSVAEKAPDKDRSR